MTLDRSQEGWRVRLLYCSDLHTRLQPGTEGTIQFVDAVGTLHVKWDDGSGLGLIPGEDQWELLGGPDIVATQEELS